MRTSKLWIAGVLVIAGLLLAALGAVTAWIDPYFHYHAPLEGMAYTISNQRYQNDGIGKHFDYDAIITGTSMTENFRTSELDALFDVNSVKLPFSGAYYKEIDQNLRRALEANPDVKLVVRCLDGYMLNEDKDTMRTDAVYPEYLYDSNWLNDVEYLLNKQVLMGASLQVLEDTRLGKTTTDFDTYSRWAEKYTCEAQRILETRGTLEPVTVAQDRTLSQESRTRIIENITQNALEIAKENPQTDFYYYFPPYSIVWWERAYRGGSLRSLVECYALASEVLLECENIHLFSFCDDYAVITDLDNYKDHEHHSGEINTRILETMAAGAHRVTVDNCEDYWQSVLEYYSGFDYAGYFG